MSRPEKRLALLVASLPVILLVTSFLYMEGMAFLEGSPRNFLQSLSWASETLTTTGYGAETTWEHPVMVLFVTVAQWLGVFLIFLIVSRLCLRGERHHCAGRQQRRDHPLSRSVSQLTTKALAMPGEASMPLSIRLTPTFRLVNALLVASLFVIPPLESQESRRRWETMRQIRLDKFDQVLPQAMRENQIDMWITMIREANYGTLWPDLGFGYTGDFGFYVFTDRGEERIERAALGIDGRLLRRSDAYDYFGDADELGDFVKERDPRRIGLNISRAIGPADTLSHSGYEQIRELLGSPYDGRIVSAEKLVSDFRSRRVATEIAAFAEAGEISRQLAERALSNEVIRPGETTLEEVAWWLEERLFDNGLDSSFGMPSIYVTGPNGIEATSNERIIQRGDLLMIDWGVGLMNLYTDMKRIAYVLLEGESEAPAALRHAFDRAIEARSLVKGAIRPGITAKEAEEDIYEALAEGGFRRIDFNQPTDDPKTTDVVIGCHSVGNSGHGIGPSIAFFNPVRITYQLRPSNLLSIELFAYTANPDWGNVKVRIPLEDDAVLTERGIEWLYPVNDRILLVK